MGVYQRRSLIDMITFEISEHAYDRMKERCGWTRKAATRMAELGYLEGIGHNKTSGQLFNYISNQAKQYMKKGACFKLYGENVFCFIKYDAKATADQKVILVTVWHIPNQYKKQALNMQKRNAKCCEST